MSAELELSGRTGRATVFTSPSFHRLQVRHFLCFDLLPLAGTAAAVAIIPWMPPSAADLGMFAILWLGTGLGLTVGFHRYFSHRSFATGRSLSLALLILGSMAARGPMISWVAMHRRHHELSDRPGDLHSPNLHGIGRSGKLRGFIYAQLTWMLRHDYPNVMHYAPDLMEQKKWLRWNRRYYCWVAIGIALPTIAGGLFTATLVGALTGFLWGGAVRIVVVEHTMSAINSLCHMFGSHPFKTRGDHSGNISWLGLLTWGESWHNNHHAFPHSAAFGLKWYELDPGFWLIRMLEAMRLVWDVKCPSPRTLAQRRLAAN